jgi:hypothetical protein
MVNSPRLTAEAQVMGALRALPTGRPGHSPTIAEETGLDVESVRDVFRSLIAQGLVLPVPDDRFAGSDPERPWNVKLV